MATFVTVLIPAWKVRAGDLIHRGSPDPEQVVAVDDARSATVAIRTEANTIVIDARRDVSLRVPVGHPIDGAGLYKADGSGIFGCVCIYRAPGGGQMHDLVHEVDDCPWHGSAYYDDED